MVVEAETAASSIDIHIPTFAVDRSLGDHIPHPLPQQAHFAAFVGPPRSGKTSLSTALLAQDEPRIYSGVFDRVYLIIPAASAASMDDSPFANHKRMYHELTDELLSAILEDVGRVSAENRNSLIIIDDFQSELKNTDLRKSLERMIANRRHLRLTVWIITQTFKSLPLSTRKMISHLFMFRPSNRRETESIRDELIMMDRRVFSEMIEHTFQSGGDPHTFMFIDVANGKVHKRFNELHESS